MATVVFEHVSKSFGGTVAVRDFSVRVEDGEFIAFLGPSGCGKTTCLRMVAGFLEPTAGRIAIGARVVSDPSKRTCVPPEARAVGMVFQSYAVWPHMTVFENAAYPLKVKSVSKPELRRRVEAVLELMQMGHLAQRYPHQLSGGQQQRVALARALVMDPEVLLLDEPLSNLDAKLREEMRLELKQLQRRTGSTIIFVTHDQMEAMVMADRIVVMEGGLVQQIGTPRDIYLNPANRFVGEFIGVASFLQCRHVEGGVVLGACPEVILPLLPPSTVAADGLTMMVRPQDVALDPDQGQLPARVVQKMFVGDAIEYLLGTGDQVIRAKTGLREDYAVGSDLRVTISAGHFFG